MNRMNTTTVVKTFRFKPGLIEDIEKILYLSRRVVTAHGQAVDVEPKFPSMTNFLNVALGELVKRERRTLEDAGIVWDHITNFKS